MKASKQPIGLQGEPIKISHSVGGYHAASFPRIIDLWNPEGFLAHDFIKTDGDEFTIAVNNGTATYQVVKKQKVGNSNWWIAKRIMLRVG